MIKHLVKLATEFDQIGKHAAADLVDELIVKVSAGEEPEDETAFNYKLLEELLNAPEPHALEQLERSMDVPEPLRLEQIDIPEWIWKRPLTKEEEDAMIGEEIIGFLPPPEGRRKPEED